MLTSHIMAQEDTHSKSSELGYDAFLVAFCRIADLWTQNKYTKLSVKVRQLVLMIRVLIRPITQEVKRTLLKLFLSVGKGQAAAGACGQRNDAPDIIVSR